MGALFGAFRGARLELVNRNQCFSVNDCRGAIGRQPLDATTFLETCMIHLNAVQVAIKNFSLGYL